MKKITWVDDNISNIGRLVDYLFYQLWERDCYSQIIFTGDNYRDGGSNIPITPTTLNEFAKKMSNNFERFCGQNVDEAHPTPKKVSEAKEYLRPTKPLHFDEKSEEVIRQKIEENIQEDSYIALDIRLFINDDILDEEIIAMNLYYYFLTKKKYSVFFYTFFNQQGDSKKKWEDKFKRYHDDLKDDDIKIFSLEKLISPSFDNKKEYNDFINFIFPEMMDSKNE